MNQLKIEQTKKLYDQDAYATQFEAVVCACTAVEDEGVTRYEVVLDQTLFFPEEGGQTPDKGTIAGVEVVDVQVTRGVIKHTLVSALEEGAKVEGQIDWTHRFNNMQQHSGEHIFSGLVNAKYGYDNVGFHLSDQIVTMDFNGVLTPEQAKEIETAANEAIIRNLEVVVSYPSKEELQTLEYRSKIEIGGQVRIVTIGDVDTCACCAPHVRRTGEIGMLKITGMQNHRGGVRISILCGFRALEDYRKKTAVIGEIATSLSANQDTLVDAVAKVKDANQSLKLELNKAKQEAMEAKLAGIPADQNDVYLFEEAVDAQVMRAAVNRLVEEHAGICGIFAGNDTEGYRFIIGSKEADARVAMQALKDTCNARGGGSQAMVQGSLTGTAEEVKKALRIIMVK